MPERPPPKPKRQKFDTITIDEYRDGKRVELLDDRTPRATGGLLRSDGGAVNPAHDKIRAAYDEKTAGVITRQASRSRTADRDLEPARYTALAGEVKRGAGIDLHGTAIELDEQAQAASRLSRPVTRYTNKVRTVEDATYNRKVQEIVAAVGSLPAIKARLLQVGAENAELKVFQARCDQLQELARTDPDGHRAALQEPQPARRGRPPKLTPVQLAHADDARGTGEPLYAIAARLGVDRRTLSTALRKAGKTK
jgi:hypothetical protein